LTQATSTKIIYSQEDFFLQLLISFSLDISLEELLSNCNLSLNFS